MSTRAYGVRAAAACVALASFAGRAQAQPASTAQTGSFYGDPEAQRTALYKEGVALANAGHWEEAVAKFREVIAIRSAPPALFTLGQAEEHIGHFVSAKRVYLRALADAQAAGGGDVADAAQKALTAVDAHIARLTVKVVPPYGASATIDGAPAVVGQPVEVDPGDHRVNVTSPNLAPFNSSVHLGDGERQTMNAVLGGGETGAVKPLEEEPSASRATSGTGAFPVGPVVLGGVGVAAAVIGLVVRQTAQSSYDTSSMGCSTSGACPTSDAGAVADGNSARTRILVGDVTLGIGIAAALGAATWWIVAPKRSSDAAATGFEVLPSPSGARTTLRVLF
jgi:hypothetical protein